MFLGEVAKFAKIKVTRKSERNCNAVMPSACVNGHIIISHAHLTESLHLSMSKVLLGVNVH